MSTRVAAAVACCLLALAGCQQKMARQPYYRPLEPSGFFPDGRSARPLVAGTVANNRPLPDARLLTGRTAGGNPAARNAGLVGLAAQGGLAPLPAANNVAGVNVPATAAAALAE